MKCTPLFIALAIALSGCSTQGHTSHDYTKGLVGIYFITYMNWDGEVVVMPEPGFSGSIRMQKVDFTHLKMVFSVKVKRPKETFRQTSDPRQLELKPDSVQRFALYDGLEKIGTISPNIIAIKPPRRLVRVWSRLRLGGKYKIKSLTNNCVIFRLVRYDKNVGNSRRPYPSLT